MGALSDYADDTEMYADDGSMPLPTPQAYGATPGFADVDLGGLGAIVQKQAQDLARDYEGANSRYEARRPQIQQANEDYAGSFMQGYDPNAYDAQAWAQAGIGAATPTLSALESLNRAVAGYSGIKLQQRADFGKRVEQEKAAKAQALQQEQAVDLATKKAAPEQLIDLYKAGLISKARLSVALANRFVNVPGVGMVDKSKLANGASEDAAVVVHGYKPAEIMQKIIDETTKEFEQDKNYHFKNQDERNAAFNAAVQRKVELIDKVHNGNFIKAIGLPIQPSSQAVIAPPTSAVPAGFTPENAAFLAQQPGKGQVFDQNNVMGAPGTTATDIAEGTSVMPDIEAQVAAAEAGQGAIQAQPATPNVVPVAQQVGADPSQAVPVMAGTAQPATPQVQPAPWARFALRPATSAKPTAGGAMYDKAGQEGQIAQNQQAEKNAENQYLDIAQKSDATTQWYDTLRQMGSMDLNSTGAFANLRNYAGKMLASMGYPDSKMAQDATNLTSLNAIIMQGIQQRLSVQNGVQARDDAIREQQSFANITDPKQVFKALIAQAQAKALRTTEQEQFFSAWKADKGTYVGAQGAWNDYIKATPLMTMYGGKPVYMQQYIDGFMKRNQAQFQKEGISEQQALDIATDDWRRISKRK